jgi:hypothetical protein
VKLIQAVHILNLDLAIWQRCTGDVELAAWECWLGTMDLRTGLCWLCNLAKWNWELG